MKKAFALLTPTQKLVIDVEVVNGVRSVGATLYDTDAECCENEDGFVAAIVLDGPDPGRDLLRLFDGINGFVTPEEVYRAPRVVS